MRLGMLASLALALVFSLSLTPVHALTSSHGTTIVALQQQPTGAGAQAQPGGKLDVDVNVNHGGGGRWYVSPVWIAIGALAVIVILALLIMAGRGGGTTIVRD